MRFKMSVEIENEVPPGWRLETLHEGPYMFHAKHGYFRPEMYLVRAIGLARDGVEDMDPAVEEVELALLDHGDHVWKVELVESTAETTG